MTEEKTDGQAATPRMVLLRINEMYRLHEGYEFLNAMLLGEGDYPRPVICMTFRDAFELNRFLSRHGASRFVGINPLIIERLRQNDELIDVAPPED